MDISNKYALKFSNEIRVNQAEKNHLITVNGKPVKVTIDSNNQCNLECPFCGYSIKNDMKLLESLPVGTLNVVSRELFDTAQIITPSTKGEPLLYYNYNKLLHLVYESLSKVEMYTNGLILKESVCIKILPVLNDLKLSIESTDKKNYLKYRVGSNLEKVLLNIKNLRKLINEYTYLNHPTITYQVNIMKSNINELYSIINSAEQNNVDRVALSHIYAFDKSFVQESLLNWKELSDEAMLKGIDVAEKLGVKLFYPQLFTEKESGFANIFKNNTCSYLYKETWISPNGDIKPCFFPDSPVMGNIVLEKFETIWNGEKYKKMRETVNTENPFYHRCKKCPIRAQFEKNSKVRYDIEGFVV